MTLDITAELRGLIDALEAAKLEYAVCGEAIVEIDLLVRHEDLERVLAVAKSVGFDIRARPMPFGLRLAKSDPDADKLLPLNLVFSPEGPPQP